jgi:hypothetical protein
MVAFQLVGFRQEKTSYKSMPAKIPRIAVYLSEELKQDLEKLAHSEKRSLSQMAAILIEQGLRQAKEKGEIE